MSDRLNRDQFVAKLTSLPLELLFKPLLSVFVPRGPDAVGVFDLFGNEFRTRLRRTRMNEN